MTVEDAIKKVLQKKGKGVDALELVGVLYDELLELMGDDAEIDFEDDFCPVLCDLLQKGVIDGQEHEGVDDPENTCAWSGKLIGSVWLK